jgi:hypothetical protein
LLLAFSENGGADSISQTVSTDVAKVQRDYGALDAAAQGFGSKDQSSTLAGDLDSLSKDQALFDRACGIATLVLPSAQTSAPPASGGSYNSADEVEQTLAEAGQECSPGDKPSLADFDGATDAAQCSSPGSASQDTQIIVFKDQAQAQSYSANAVVGIQGVPAHTTALAGRNWVLTTTSSTYAQAAVQILGGTLLAPVDAPSPTPAATAAPEQVTYRCTGHGGVDITYGANGSEHSASSLPFKHTDPLMTGAQYYVVSAQLQGGGSVSCTTDVQTDDLLGYAQVVSNSGSADGGYNIATAEVCSGIDGWQAC